MTCVQLQLIHMDALNVKDKNCTALSVYQLSLYNLTPHRTVTCRRYARIGLQWRIQTFSLGGGARGAEVAEWGWGVVCPLPRKFFSIFYLKGVLW